MRIIRAFGLLLLLILGTQCINRPAIRPAPPMVRDVQGDLLPTEMLPVLEGPPVRLGGPIPEVDAILISHALLLSAKANDQRKQALQMVAKTTVLLVAGGTTQELQTILELHNATATMDNGERHVVVAIRSTPEKIIAGGMIIVRGSYGNDLVKDIQDFVRDFQKLALAEPSPAPSTPLP